MATDTKALAIPELPEYQPIRNALAPFMDPSKFNVITPTTFVGVSPIFVPMPVVVEVNPADKRAVYPTPGANDGSLCLHSSELEKIANAGGLDFDPSLERHVHDFVKEPYLCQMSVGGWYLDPIGQRRLVGDGVTHDLRDGSKRAKLLLGQNNSIKALEAGRQFICEQARSRARARVIRKCMNLASSYRAEELRKPFVALRFRMNEADEDVKKALIARGVGATSEVFGERGVLPPPPAADRMEDVIEGTATEAEAPEPEIPDEPEAVDVNAIATAFKQRAKARPDQDKASDEQLTSLALALGTLFGLPNRKGNKDDKLALSAARKGIASTLYGVGVTALTAAQVNVVVEAVKDPQLQSQLASLADVIGIQKPADLAAAAKGL